MGVEKNILRDAHRIGAGGDQFAGQLKGGSAERTVGEAAGIGEHGGVEAGGHLRGDGCAGGAHQPVDHLAYAGSLAIDPVEVGVAAAAEVVIDVDEVIGIQAVEAGALQAVALEQDDRVVGYGDFLHGADSQRAGKAAIEQGDMIGSDHVGLFAHLLEEHGEGQHAAQSVAIGAGVGAEQEAPPAAQDLKDGLHGVGRRERGRRSAHAVGCEGGSERRFRIVRGQHHGAKYRARSGD